MKILTGREGVKSFVDRPLLTKVKATINKKLDPFPFPSESVSDATRSR